MKGGVPPISTSEAKSRKKKAKKRKGGNTNVPAGDAAPATAEDAAEETTSPTKVDAGDSDDSEPEESDARRVGTSTETSVDDEAVAALTNGMNNADLSDTAARFDVLVKDRDALRTEVTRLRQALEALQSKHDKDLESVKEQLQDTQNEKDEAQEQYQNLLGKVNTIRSQLGERLKADAEDLAQARTRIEELEEQKSGLQEQYTAKSAEVEELTSENQAQSKELSSLRNRANLSQQNWIKERNELVEQEAYMREEFENTKQAMHDWEVLAMEERTVRKDLADRASDLEEQLASLKQAYDKADSDRTTQSNAVEGLQKALQEIQTARKIELRELVESSQAESESLKKQLHEAQVTATTATTELEITRKELERASPFEKEVKEKNLLIGKLRHEAVILNDHLTKALRFLKKGKPEDNVDRQIVTSYLIQFLALDRADPKKFQILQLIAALLGWTDEQKERAGLQRTGAPSMTGSLRLPGSPLVHRTPSTPALGSDYFPDSVTSPDRKESLADLWQNFLEQEASQSSTSRGGKSRTASTSTVSTPKP